MTVYGQREFFRAAALYLSARLYQEENPPNWGATLGELDATAELALIIEEEELVDGR